MEMKAWNMLAMLLFAAALPLIFTVQNSATQGGSFSLASAGRCGNLPYPRTIRSRAALCEGLRSGNSHPRTGACGHRSMYGYPEKPRFAQGSFVIN